MGRCIASIRTGKILENHYEKMKRWLLTFTQHSYLGLGQDEVRRVYNLELQQQAEEDREMEAGGRVEFEKGELGAERSGEVVGGDGDKGGVETINVLVDPCLPKGYFGPPPMSSDTKGN